MSQRDIVIVHMRSLTLESVSGNGCMFGRLWHCFACGGSVRGRCIESDLTFSTWEAERMAKWWLH